jgi:4,5-dihydroxyphthalate decarboxylase
MTRRLSIALERYDRHVPFFMNLVPLPEGLALQPFEVGMVPPPRRHGLERHARMLHAREFDIAETSLCSYLIAKDRGSDLTAVPVFPRRLFSATNMFVSTASGIRQPRDLVGKRVGVYSFQTTFSVLARGDLKFEYGVSWDKVRWVAQHREELELEIQVEYAGEDIAGMLLDGRLDAIFHPHPPAAVLAARDRVRRLFPDASGEAKRYFRKHGYYPIMHLLVAKPEAFDEVPGLGPALVAAWDRAAQMAVEFWEDPGYGVIAFARQHLEDQEEALGTGLWSSGLAANRASLERFAMYARDQGLIRGAMPLEGLFHPSTLLT